ncbi:hypothetical protein LMG26854_03359 [Achromobacter aegrifaciens]|uniref:hypothetical protein n=1 Tax=Achromobacter aegrifaciens TaxID=1287736 RepID=UPI001468A083|nr:hypothetical protein [Achromobacter aegrifaciens]CAB3858801.1 hypothetical protein LMG26854_03359 [Achromobacter aegrifaciens]
MKATKKAPLLARLQAAINCAHQENPGWLAPVMREARDEIKRLRRELRTEQRRAKWNGKT